MSSCFTFGALRSWHCSKFPAIGESRSPAISLLRLVEKHTLRLLPARAIRRPCLPGKEYCRDRPVPAPSMQISTRGSVAAPTENGAFPSSRSSSNAAQSKSFSRSTGVVVSTRGVTRPPAFPIEIDAGKSLIDLQRTKLARLRVYVFPVVKPECHVAVLLNLKNNNAVP